MYLHVWSLKSTIISCIFLRYNDSVCQLSSLHSTSICTHRVVVILAGWDFIKKHVLKNYKSSVLKVV